MFYINARAAEKIRYNDIHTCLCTVQQRQSLSLVSLYHVQSLFFSFIILCSKSLPLEYFIE